MNGDNLQRAIYNKLTEDGEALGVTPLQGSEPIYVLSPSAGISGARTLSQSIRGVYADIQQPDEPEDNALFPYVTIGQDNLEAWDTKTHFGVNALCQIDVWSRQNNYLEVKEISKQIYDMLHATSLTITGATHVLTRVESQDFTIDEDGHTKRGLMLVRVIYDEI